MTQVHTSFLSNPAFQPLVATDPEQTEFEHRMAKTIQDMPEDVRDRFKALFVLHVSTLSPTNSVPVQLQTNELDEEEEKAYRELELKYDKLYQEVYE